MGSLLLFPWSWCTQSFVCALKESVSPVLCKLCKQIPWPPKSDSLGVLSPLPDPQVGKSVASPRTFLPVWEFFGIIALQFVGRLLSSSVVGLMDFPERAYATDGVSQVAAPRALRMWQALTCVSAGDPNTGLAPSLWCAWALVHKGFVWALRASLADMEFDSKCDFAPPTILLVLLLCSWTCGIFVDGCSAASCNFGVLTGEDEHMSFCFTILCLPLIK